MINGGKISFDKAQRALLYSLALQADVAELADALDLGSSTARCEGSIPFIRTTCNTGFERSGLFFYQQNFVLFRVL